MKCYNHPETDAVGTCSQCGKAGCRECIEDVGGALLCRDCIAQEIFLESAHARRCIRNSWIVAGLGILPGLFVASVSNSIAGGLALSLLYIYFFWSTYWGFKWLWPKWTRMLQRGGCILFLPIFYWLIVLLVLWEIAAIYGMLGGALYQYFRYRSIAKAGAGIEMETKRISPVGKPETIPEMVPVKMPRKTRVRWVLPLLIAVVAVIGISVIINWLRGGQFGTPKPRHKPGQDISSREMLKPQESEKSRLSIYPSTKIQAHASSQLEDVMTKKYGPGYYAPTNTLDGKLNTAWSEGVPGDGIGEFIRYDFSDEISVKGIKIVSGYSKSDKIFYANNRLRKIRLSFDRARFVEVPLKDSQDWQTIDFGEAFLSKRVTLTILEVYSGTKYEDTAFSEIQFLY